MNPIEALTSLERQLRDLRRTNVARLLAAEEMNQDSLGRLVALQEAIETVQRALLDERAGQGTGARTVPPR